MSLAQVAVDRPKVTWFATGLVLVAGVASFFQLGMLEDPEFSIKTAQVVTSYPGADPQTVELEVTDPLEIAIQQMPQIKYVQSLSRPGKSQISVEIKPEYPSSALPQIWDELRKKVRDAAKKLPPGAGAPTVADDFGDVYGFLMALTRDGFSAEELEDQADALKKELSLVEGVSRVELWGVRRRCIYIDVAQTQLVERGLTLEALQRTLSEQNLVVDAGGVDLGEERLRITQTGEFTSPQDIEDLVIRGRSGIQAAAAGQTATGSRELLRIRDIGTVRRGFVQPPDALLRYSNQDGSWPAIGISVSNRPGANVVELGKNLETRLAELYAQMPIGLELHEIAWQEDLVTESINGFVVSLVQAVAIVLVVLALAMGIRMALIVGSCGLVFTIIASLLFMAVLNINLQRMSLGALIIAMGMMVDNAIVVADGIMVRFRQGMERRKAAIEAASQPAWPLLGATLIAVLAFYPIAASTEGSGEYCLSLFQVVGISLLLSWVLSVTVTPLMCLWLLPSPKSTDQEQDPYSGGLFQSYRGMVTSAIRFRWLVVIVMIGLLIASGVGFGFIDKTFFPDSSRLQVMVDYWAPEGTKIQTVAENTKRIEDKVREHDAVTSVSTFIGQGPPRFYLPVEPEKPYHSYAQFIVNVSSLDELNQFIPEMDGWLKDNVPEAITIVRRYGLGPSKTWKVEGRFTGPALADPETLRKIGNEAVDIVKASPHAEVVRTNWRQRRKTWKNQYAQERARLAGISRSNVARATKRAYDGYQVGLYREADKLYPILLRNSEEEREDVPSVIDSLPVHADYSTDPVPLLAVSGGMKLKWEDPIIWRRDRRRMISVQANAPDGVPASALQSDVAAKLENMELPPGYRFEWGGEYESSRDSQAALIPGIIPAVAVMAMIVVALFGTFRPPIIIALVIPFAAIGITTGLLITRQPFGFMSLLGAMSLAGMMIKNSIVLLDQVNIEKDAGKSDYGAVIDASLSRVRPVVLAAATTVLGMIPLLPDVFWVSMAVTIMFGLAFGTVLTMIMVPVFYACLYRLPQSEEA